jgi:hypothetical protein
MTMTTLSQKALSDIDNYNQLRQDEIDLVNHIKAINKKSKQEMIDNPSWYIGMMVEDYQHWLDMGITNIKQFERYLDETTLYEAVSTATTKSYARTVLSESSKWSDEYFAKELDKWCKSADDEIAYEKKMEEENLDKFWKSIEKNIKLGASDKKTAIDWYLAAEGLDKERDPKYINYSLGISYDSVDFSEHVKQLN